MAALFAAATLTAPGASAQQDGDPPAGPRFAEAWCSSNCHVISPGASGAGAGADASEGGGAS